MSDAQQLTDMGFTQYKVLKALTSTKNSGLQPALDWLIAHSEDPEPTAEEQEAFIASGGKSASTTAAGGDDEDDDEGELKNTASEAKSLKCMQCNKTFRNTALANYHATKSGHDQFEESAEEIKPLTESEKAEKLEELRERMVEKKKLNAKRDAEEAKVNEAIRRKGGQDQSQIKADMELKAVNKAALERKQDKIDDLKAKAAVRAQIEADKAARALKSAREKAIRDGQPVPTAPSTSAPAPAARASASTSNGDGTTRLQFRLMGGGVKVVVCETSKTLGELYKEMEADESVTGFSGCHLVCSFPRKTYADAELAMTLKQLGLFPSAVIICAV